MASQNIPLLSTSTPNPFKMAIAASKSPRGAMNPGYGDLIASLETVLRPRHGIMFSEEDKCDILRVLKTFRVEIPSSPPPVPFKSYDPQIHYGYGPPVALDRGFYFPATHPDYQKFYGGSPLRANTSSSLPSSSLSEDHRKSYRSPAPSPPPSAPHSNHLSENAPTPRVIQYTDVYGRPISPNVVAKFHGEAPKPRNISSMIGKAEPVRNKSPRASPTSFVDSNTVAAETKVHEQKHSKINAHNEEETEQKVVVKGGVTPEKKNIIVKKNDHGKEENIIKNSSASPNQDKAKSKTTQESAISQNSQTQRFLKAAANIKQKRAAPHSTSTPTATAQAQPITAPWPPASTITSGPDMIRNLGARDEVVINRAHQCGSPFASASTGASFYSPFGEDEADDDVDPDEDTEDDYEEYRTPRTMLSTQPTQESPPTDSFLGKRGQDFDESENESEDEDEDRRDDVETAKGASRFTSPGGDRRHSKRFKKD